MSITSRMKSTVLRIVLVVTAVLGILAYVTMPNNVLRALAMISASALVVYLWKILMSDRPLAERRRKLAVAPKGSQVVKGLLVGLTAFPWVLLCGLAVRYHILSDSPGTVLIIGVPAGAFFLLGILIIVRAYYRAFRGP